MPLFLKSGLYFIHIPRSGGSYIENLFHANGDTGAFLSPYQFFNGCSPQHQPLIVLNTLHMIPEGFKIFTVIRDDAKRFFSEFNWMKKRCLLPVETSFSQFLTEGVLDKDGKAHPFLDINERKYYDNHNMPNEWFTSKAKYPEIISMDFDGLYSGGNSHVAFHLNQILSTSLIAYDTIDKNDSLYEGKSPDETISEQDRLLILEHIEKVANFTEHW